MKKILVTILVVLVAMTLFACGETDNGEVKDGTDKDNNVVDVVDTPKEYDWNDEFKKYNYTDDDIAWMKEIMNNVGIFELELMPNNYTDCSKGLCALRSKINEVTQLNFTTENGKLFYVQVAWGEGSADLYYDVNGGYINYYDKDNHEITSYKNKK